MTTSEDIAGTDTTEHDHEPTLFERLAAIGCKVHHEIHDELILDCPEGKVSEAQRILLDANSPRHFFLGPKPTPAERAAFLASLDDGTWRKGDWNQTFSGKQFYPLDPRPEDICIEDIAHHLALQTRFGGACRVPYSIAEHSVRVSRICPPEDALWGLLHDASEAYVGDVMRAFKQSEPMRGYREVEANIQRVIARKFGLPEIEPESVRRADSVLLFTEARDLMSRPPNVWKHVVEPLEGKIIPWSWFQAEQLFLQAFYALTGGVAR